MNQGFSRARLLGILLKPLARFCLRHALSFQDLTAAAKGAFVTVALEDMKESGEKINVSRISAVTGLVRQEVKRLIDNPVVPEYQPNVSARVVSAWESDKRFSERGKPKELTCGFNGSEFHSLVYAVSQQLNAATVLFDLERSAMIERKGDKVQLVKRVVRLRTDADKGFEIIAGDVDTVIRAAEQNILEAKPVSNLHLRTDYDNVLVSKLPDIRRWLIDEGKRFHKKAREYISQFDADLNPAEGQEAGVKVSVSTASFTSQFPDFIEHIPEVKTPQDV